MFKNGNTVSFLEHRYVLT